MLLLLTLVLSALCPIVADLDADFDREIEELQSLVTESGDSDELDAGGANFVPFEVSSALQQLSDEYSATSNDELELADAKDKLRHVMDYERRMMSTCTSGGVSSKSCPMRGSIFMNGNMKEAVVNALGQEFPDYDRIVAPCLSAAPPTTCETPPAHADTEEAFELLKKTFAARLRAMKEFTMEFQTKGLNLVRVMTEQANLVQFKERRPKTPQTDAKQQFTRYMHVYNTVAFGKLVTGLANLMVTGMEEVNMAFVIGPLSLFIPMSSYAASLLFYTTDSKTKPGAQVAKLMKQMQYGLQTQLTHVHALLDKKIQETHEFKGNFNRFLVYMAWTSAYLTKWMGNAMGDKECFQSDEDCDYQAKAHLKMSTAGHIEEPWTAVQKHTSGHAGKHSGGDTKDFSRLLDIVTKSDEVIGYLQTGNAKMLPKSIAELANTWNGLVAGQPGEVGRRSMFQEITNIRTNDPNREHMRITGTFKKKDLASENKLHKLLKHVFDEMTGQGAPGQQQAGGQQAPQQSPAAAAK